MYIIIHTSTYMYTFIIVVLVVFSMVGLRERQRSGGWYRRGAGAEMPSYEKYSNRFSLSDLKFVGLREALASAKYFKSLASHPRLAM